jgi:RNA polymerase sigma-70 factor, ECF subfamily
MGDPLAHPEELIRRVYAYVAYRIGGGPEAEDLTSETLERGLKYRSTYDARKGEPAAWLIGIARNVIADNVRKSALEPFEVEEVDAGIEERSVERLDLARGLTTLEPRDQELLALRYGGDLTARQIAELLELKTNAVEVALHRALARLRTALEEPASSDSGAEAQSVAPRVA